MSKSLISNLERGAIALRHAPGLSRASILWDQVRPVYDSALARLGRDGLMRVMNGTDPMLLSPRGRGIGDIYEPALWQALVAEVRPGDVVADVGAWVGLYSLAMGRRVMPGGRVYAFEPDPQSFALLAEHVRLNELESSVCTVRAAVGACAGERGFTSGRGLESHVTPAREAPGTRTPLVPLDQAIPERHLDVLKIDVEGFELDVLRGATRLLTSDFPPRAIFIEVHPYMYAGYGIAGDDLLRMLSDCGYQVTDLEGMAVTEIHEYGEIVARRKYRT